MGVFRIATWATIITALGNELKDTLMGELKVEIRKKCLGFNGPLSYNIKLVYFNKAIGYRTVRRGTV